MIKKILGSFFLLALILSGVGLAAQDASAQTPVPNPFPTFPAGCSSAIGYSVTTGLPCNGTSAAATLQPGCPTVLGYSTVNGTPCSGISVALPYLAGCSSIYSFSTITGAPCNGTAFVSMFPPTTPPVVIITDPGLPTTGAGGNALSNILALLSSGVVMVIGSAFLARKYRAS